jgi:biopolymer transport protein ExbD
MKFKIPVEGGDDEINMAPMIDMVFLLLIFFMVASQLNKMDRRPVELPVADKSKVPDIALGRQMITLESKTAEGDEVMIYMNLNEVQLEDIGPAIKKRYEENNSLKVYLRADRYVKHRHIKAVMEACTEAGIADVIIATFESGN